MLSFILAAQIIQMPATNNPIIGTMRLPHFFPHLLHAPSLSQPPLKHPTIPNKYGNDEAQSKLSFVIPLPLAK